jgi:hypothetical protein
MTAEERIAAARATAEELSEIIRGEGRAGLVWQQRMRQIVDDLSVSDTADALAAARERFDSLYAGGRNFADFHLWRTDESQRIAANERLSGLVKRLRELLI